MDNTFLGILTGCDFHTPPNSTKAAVAERAKVLIPNIVQRPGLEHPAHLWHERHCYDGNRCKPENLGWRFEQMWGSHEPQEILDGKLDAEIEETYHEAASSEYWYRYEKDWG